MSYYYHAQRNAVREFDPAVFAAWVAASSPKATGWVLIPDPPSSDHRYTGTAWAVPSATTRHRIREAALRRKLSGGFLPTAPANNTKWLSSDPQTLATLACYAAAASALPASLSVKAMDGTGYGLTKARVQSALDAYALQMSAIDKVEAEALAAQQANPTTFDFNAIVWPAVYVAA